MILSYEDDFIFRLLVSFILKPILIRVAKLNVRQTQYASLNVRHIVFASLNAPQKWGILAMLRGSLKF